ncbi:chromate transporter [Paenibacillus sp. GP183]|jgi:chromate transporter|uniref:chromate transporter n=1 Tax=Paenibacillus sp. GP183 TaxID=1882751 RepID=UPI000894F6CF|nr:chromate transporter [Paenibacillus sp. GP183]SEB73226.1 chromate transporter [Paenibacillus sp. GP183]
MEYQENQQSTVYAQLAWAMCKTGILGYGGGPSVIPLIRYEAVNKYGWMKDEEFGEILALANALPGPIATKMAAYLGYSQRGVLGAVIAVLSHIIPSSIAMIALLSAVYVLSGSKIIQGIISTVVPVIAVMLGQMAYEFGERAMKGLGKPLGFALFAISFLLLQIIHVHPAIVIAMFLLYGAFHLKTLGRFKERKQRNKNIKREDSSTWTG